MKKKKEGPQGKKTSYFEKKKIKDPCTFNSGEQNDIRVYQDTLIYSCNT